MIHYKIIFGSSLSLWLGTLQHDFIVIITGVSIPKPMLMALPQNCLGFMEGGMTPKGPGMNQGLMIYLFPPPVWEPLMLKVKTNSPEKSTGEEPNQHRWAIQTGWKVSPASSQTVTGDHTSLLLSATTCGYFIKQCCRGNSWSTRF